MKNLILLLLAAFLLSSCVRKKEKEQMFAEGVVIGKTTPEDVNDPDGYYINVKIGADTMDIEVDSATQALTNVGDTIQALKLKQ